MLCVAKFHSEAETAIVMQKKLLLEQYMSCKSTLEAAKSGYFTSVASEMGTSSPKIGWCSRKVLVCTGIDEKTGLAHPEMS